MNAAYGGRRTLGVGNRKKTRIGSRTSPPFIAIMPRSSALSPLVKWAYENREQHVTASFDNRWDPSNPAETQQTGPRSVSTSEPHFQVSYDPERGNVHFFLMARRGVPHLSIDRKPFAGLRGTVQFHPPRGRGSACRLVTRRANEGHPHRCRRECSWYGR
jgi:hypothetical protein